MKKILFLGLGAAALISLYSCASSGGAASTAAKQSPAEQLPVVSSTMVNFPVPVVDLSGVSTWYVRESGDDQHDGTSEGTAFKTLARAVYVASQAPIKTITVIGTLTTPVKIEQLSFDDEILITGKTGATGTDAAGFVKGNNRDLDISDAVKIRLEDITLGNGISVSNGAVVTMGNGAKIKESGIWYAGGGAFITEGSTFIMEGGAEISGCDAQFGGGVCLTKASSMIMKGNAVIKGNTALVDPEAFDGGKGGGIYLIEASTLAMQDNAMIQENRAVNLYIQGGNKTGGAGGGIFAYQGNITLQDNAQIVKNKTPDTGGGLFIGDDTTLELKGSSSIRENEADGIMLVIRDGKFQSLRAIQYGLGGGVCAAGTAKMTMGDNSTVQDNQANWRGGGISYAKTVVFTRGTGTVSGNKAGEEGPDIYQE